MEAIEKCRVFELDNVSVRDNICVWLYVVFNVVLL